jgi:DNA-binding response OmpR family regulator
MTDTTEKKFILIVEDDNFLSDIYQNQLQQAGFETRVVIDGQAALVAVKEKIPNLITLDMIMPGMNGFDFFETLRQDKKYEDIPVMILTNLGQENDKKRCLELKKCSYFVKTEISIDDVISKIKEQVL